MKMINKTIILLLLIFTSGVVIGDDSGLKSSVGVTLAKTSSVEFTMGSSNHRMLFQFYQYRSDESVAIRVRPLGGGYYDSSISIRGGTGLHLGYRYYTNVGIFFGVGFNSLSETGSGDKTFLGRADATGSATPISFNTGYTYTFDNGLDIGLVYNYLPSAKISGRVCDKIDGSDSCFSSGIGQVQRRSYSHNFEINEAGLYIGWTNN